MHLSTLEGAKVIFPDGLVLASLRESGHGGGIMTVIPRQWTVLQHVSKEYFLGVLVDVCGVLLLVVNVYIPPVNSVHSPKGIQAYRESLEDMHQWVQL